MRFGLFVFMLLPAGILAQHHSPIHVFDQQSQESLPFAHLINITAQKGHVTNESGKVSLSAVATDEYKVTYIGYETLYYSGKQLEEIDTIFLKPMSFALDEVVVGATAPDAWKLLKAAKKKYKKRPSTTSLVFRGIYEERLMDSGVVSEMQVVFDLTDYDNHYKSTFFNFMQYEGEIVLLGMRINNPPQNDPIQNGMRWLCGHTQVLNTLGHGRDWDFEQIDSVKMDGQELIYWISTHSDKWGIQHVYVINDRHEILMIEGFGSFPSKIVFDAEISLDYPIFSSFRIPSTSFNNEDLISQESEYTMQFLETRSAFPYSKKQIMGGEKMYHDDAKSMWRQKAIDPNFDWSKYEGIDFPN